MITIADILSYLNAEQISYIFQGDPTCELSGFSSLVNYRKGTFTWIKNQENIPENMDMSQVALAVVSENVTVETVPNVIQTTESKRAFFGTIEHFFEREEERPAIGQFTYIGPWVKLGKDVRIGHNCTLDGDITIGDHTVIWNNVVIVNRVEIGSNCVIHSGNVIGHDGFGYAESENGRKYMIKHFGGVRIGNDVTICENGHVARGTIDDTVIEDGVKIDAHAHIAHNCLIKRNAAFAMPCTLCGSVTIGENSYLSGATVMNQLSIGRNANVGIRSVVISNVPNEESVFGYPARRTFPRKP